jgi:hypothetical protein
MCSVSLLIILSIVIYKLLAVLILITNILSILLCAKLVHYCNKLL